jgi:hypothetical protein
LATQGDPVSKKQTNKQTNKKKQKKEKAGFIDQSPHRIACKRENPVL